MAANNGPRELAPDPPPGTLSKDKGLVNKGSGHNMPGEPEPDTLMSTDMGIDWLDLKAPDAG
jgi:hypothetical protein